MTDGDTAAIELPMVTEVERVAPRLLNIVAPSGSGVDLDGAAVSDWDPVGATGFEVARVSLQPGAHHVQSQGGVRFGITTHGYASFTSYLYPGGLNFTR